LRISWWRADDLQSLTSSCELRCLSHNIAEGEGRSTTKDRRHYLVQARGSLYELETQLEVVTRAKLAKDVTGVRTLMAKIGKGLSKMIDHRDQL